MDCLPSLRHLDISDCPALESFPEMGFLSTGLQRLVIHRCQNLSLLPIRIQSHFPSLRELSIRNCPNVVSLIEAVGGVQRNLTKLQIWDCEKLRRPIPEWGLGMLSSLERLDVIGRCPATADVVSFPDDNCCWLPTSLKYLRIGYFTSLESVSMGLQMLTSLEDLAIEQCPKLRSLPKEALPFSLERMFISGCPLLIKDDFSERKGLYVDYYD
ncbi:putative disease resistance protein At3g14460 [Tripterygium wilfordii]|uniref:putative disease resistance protein At3g14460 n=1 Tax=Tripterygium wilfordii TaxID=458696 RepID=UPI0018F81A4F|nr:putative disease resistance protein At3g14460 [Tripterygium wilfordii]